MKLIRNILKYICLGTLIICLFPIVVFADTTYVPIENPTNCFEVFSRVSNGETFYCHTAHNVDLRYTVFRPREGQVIMCLVSDEYFQAYEYNSNSCSNGGLTSGTSTRVGDHTYYVKSYRFSESALTSYQFLISNIVRYNDIQNYENDKVNAKAVELTFGESAEGPTIPINWGLLRDTEYSTRIAGQGLAAKRNIDYLSWNNEVDANGNDISECNVHIKAVLGSWSDTTAEGLLNKTYNDFNIGNYTAVDLGTVSASSGTYSVSWERIINEAGWNFDSLYSHLEDNIFLKQGWYYQICLVDPGGVEHQYQTLYTPLSSSAAASETVINHNSFDTSIYQVYQELSTINNNTSITINIEGTDYTVTNPDDGDEPSEGTDLWDILKQMLNGIFQIVKNIAALPGKFLEMIQHLITPPQQISEEINTNFNNNMDVLENSQSGIVESMNAVEDLQDTLNESVNSFDGVPQCMFTWDAVTLDLSAFQAGNVTFIPAGSFDFAASFMQMITGFGMTYSEYQFYVSAIIYAWILVFIYRHVYAFLAGTSED